jgi:hypothetical protein
MPDQTCQTCRHFSPDYMRDECRRYPPTTDRVWPMVYAFDWCGEWAGEEEEEPRNETRLSIPRL